MKTDIQIAQAALMKPIEEIAEKLSIDSEFLDCYGKYKAKINLSFMSTLKGEKDGKLILVTAISPTKAGEGKSTTTIGLTDALSSLNKSVVACIREPSLGPVFGLKGGATGGGMSQVVPMEDINLHFTGDMHAITTANNLISAVLDNSIYQGNVLNIDPNRVVWKRCLDCNDRTLRNITIAQGTKFNGVERKDEFCITVATEVMAVLCLSNSLKDFENKMKKAIVAYTFDGQTITVGDLGIEGALAVVMKEAIKPNLVQTLENTPALIHGGPFANIAHGCNSIVATKLGLKLADYVVTEAGFGADLGAEKFLDIKCRKAGLKPNVIVIVATIRALKLHGGVLYEELSKEDLDSLKEGVANLEKHIDSIEQFKVPFVVAINRFSQDSEKEIAWLKSYLKEKDIPCEVSEGWAHGSKGVCDLAKVVIELCEQESQFEYLYELDSSIEQKIETIAKRIYGASGVNYSEEAINRIKQLNDSEYSRLPICMAKTPISLSDDPLLLGRPRGFNITVKDISVSAGAGFIVVLTGKVMTMPGLPKIPAAVNMGIDQDGKSFGIF